MKAGARFRFFSFTGTNAAETCEGSEIAAISIFVVVIAPRRLLRAVADGLRGGGALGGTAWMTSLASLKLLVLVELPPFSLFVVTLDFEEVVDVVVVEGAGVNGSTYCGCAR